MQVKKCKRLGKTYSNTSFASPKLLPCLWPSRSPSIRETLIEDDLDCSVGLGGPVSVKVAVLLLTPFFKVKFVLPARLGAP